MENHNLNGRVLAYVGVYEKLHTMILDNTFPQGTPLPSEPKLASMIGVSRMTLRQALSLLEDDGLIRKIRGKGNFVTSGEENKSPTVPHGLEKLGSAMYTCCKEVIDEVETEFYVEISTEHVRQLLGRNTAVTVTVNRWYRSNGNIVGYTLTAMPIEMVSKYRLDLNDMAQMEAFFQSDSYELADSAKLNIKISGSANFIAEKYEVTDSPEVISIWEYLYVADDSLPILCNKHFLVPPYHSVEFQIKK